MTINDEAIIRPGDETYEALRSRFHNTRVPSAKPVEIYQPTTTAEVALIVKSAATRGLHVGVRSGGHKFAAESLIEGGILIDTKKLNKQFEYNEATTEVAFSPGATVEEFSAFIRTLGRFFPHGHNATVGLGGFCLAGGQGFFLRGWGYTSDSWLTQFECVTPQGDIIIANQKENADLFWAAPGSGLGFFGVITRIWGRTIPAKKLFQQTWVLDGTEHFKDIAKWMLNQSDRVPRYGSNIMLATSNADKDDANGDDESKSRRIFVAVDQTIYASKFVEAETYASPFATLPEGLGRLVVHHQPLIETNWEENFVAQDKLVPKGDNLRWVVDSICIGPELDYDEVVERITPAMIDLPSRQSMGTFCPAECYPDGKTSALSLPVKWALNTQAAYKNPSRDEYVTSHIVGMYRELGNIASGQYAADFAPSQRIAKIMSDDVLRKWLKAREEWDPEEMFIGYRDFEKALGC